MRKSAILVTSFLAVIIVSAATPTAQTKPTLKPADYDQFESVSAGAPRGGLSPKVPRILLERRPKRLTYLSCHPATLARDLRLLKEAYRIETIALIDLFPQTGHMEALVQMSLEP